MREILNFFYLVYFICKNSEKNIKISILIWVNELNGNMKIKIDDEVDSTPS